MKTLSIDERAAQLKQEMAELEAAKQEDQNRRKKEGEQWLELMNHAKEKAISCGFRDTKEENNDEDQKIHAKWTFNQVAFNFSAFVVSFACFMLAQWWQGDWQQEQLLNAAFTFTKPLFLVSLGFLGLGLTFYSLKRWFPAVLLAINEKVNTITITDILVNKASADGKLYSVLLAFLALLMYWAIILTSGKV
jgi:hypothetical protein